MATITQQAPTVKAGRKPARRARISKPVNGNYAVELTVGKKECRYWLEPFAAAEGSAFLMKKWEEYHVEGEPDSYHVLLGADLAHSSCECKGWLRHGHCKHAEGLLALAAEGKLALQPSKAPTSAPCCDFDDNF